MGQLWTVAVLPFLAAVVGGWFSARFALHRFYKERAWERKTQTYTAIFEAIHDMDNWFDTHWNAEIEGREVPEEKRKELTTEYLKALATLRRRLAAETWLIPAECAEPLNVMMKELKKEHKSWFDDLDAGGAAVSRAAVNLRELVRRDLGLDASWQNSARLKFNDARARLQKALGRYHQGK